MLGTYLAVLAPEGIAPDTRDEAARLASHHRLPQRMTTSDVLLFSAAPVISLGDTGVMIGQVAGIDEQDLQALGDAGRRSGGRMLMSRCWGDYLALIRDPVGQCVMAIRSPPGGVPALRATRGSATLLSSSIEMLLSLGITPAIDWTFVTEHLAFPHLRSHRTGLAAVDEIIGGECLTVGHGKAMRRSIWTPWQIARPDQTIASPDAAAELIRSAILRSVEELSRPFSQILLELSGGLDSSILAAALSRAGQRAIAVNLTTPGPEGDERLYARAAAQATHQSLIEETVAADLDLAAPVWSRTARPGIPAMLRAADRQFLTIAKRKGCDAYFSGSGGDCVFAMPESATPAADALLTFGIGRRFLRTAMAVAEIHEASIWRAAIFAWRQAHRSARPWPAASTFLSREQLPTLPPPHPWLNEPEEALPGKRAHVRAILATLGHLDGYARQAFAPSIYPLLSQPVIEACLRVPSWLWVEGGRNRAIARRAFHAMLPELVIERRTKGAMDAYCVRNYDRNRPNLSRFLGGGHLAAAGLIDLDELLPFLSNPPTHRDTRFYDLLPIIDCEAWLRGWLGEPE